MKTYLKISTLLVLSVGLTGLTGCGGGGNLFASVLYAYDEANKNPVPETPPAGFEKIDVKSKSGNRVVGWALEGKPGSPVVIYFHGNAMNIQTTYTGGFFRKLNELGATAVSFDYPKYGLSTGELNQNTVLEASQATIDWVKVRFPNSPLVLWGQSLGTAAASLSAAANDGAIDGLILTSPWNSAWKLIKAKTGQSESWCKDQAKGNEYEQEVAAPNIHALTLIQHGTIDDVVPFELGKDLSTKFLSGVATFVPLQGKKHNDVFSDPSFWGDVKHIIDSAR